MEATVKPARKRIVRKKKNEVEELAAAVEKFEKIARKLYDLGATLGTAARMANLIPVITADMFSFREGMFASPNTRAAFRSACWRMQIMEGVDDEESCYVQLLLGPYKYAQPSRKAQAYLAWLGDYIFRPFNFRRMGDEAAVEPDSAYHVYQTTLPVPRAVIVEVKALLCQPRPAFQPEHEIQAFDLLEPYYTNSLSK